MKDWLIFYKDAIIAFLTIAVAFSLLIWLVIYKKDMAEKQNNECLVLCKQNGYSIFDRSEDICKCFNEPKLFRMKRK